MYLYVIPNFIHFKIQVAMTIKRLKEKKNPRIFVFVVMYKYVMIQFLLSSCSHLFHIHNYQFSHNAMVIHLSSSNQLVDLVQLPVNFLSMLCFVQPLRLKVFMFLLHLLSHKCLVSFVESIGIVEKLNY